MTANMTKTGFINTLRSDYETWVSTLKDVPEDRMTEAGAAGDWSVKDLIAHITVYEKWTVEWLEPTLRGEAPVWNYPANWTTSDDSTASLDVRNERFYEQNRDRKLDDIRSEADDIHARMLTVIDRIPEDVITRDIRQFAPQVGEYYRDGTTVWEAIDGNAAEHYREHTADIRRWLGK